MTRRSKAQKNGELWKNALERAQLGVWDWDLQTGHCFYSATWARMLGYEESELSNDSDLWVRLAHPDDRERAIASGDGHIAGLTEGIETEIRFRHKDGHWVWVLDRGGVVERDRSGKPLRLIGVLTDISKQKAAELELEGVNARFRLALTASGIGLWHHDIDAKVSFWDQRTREIFGVPDQNEEISTETWHDFLHPLDRDYAELAHAAPMRSEGVTKLRYRIIRRDGEIRVVETLIKLIANPNTSGTLVGTTQDVTDEVTAAEALKLEKERLRVTLRSISDAVVSTDTDGTINFVNRSAALLLRQSETDLVGLQFVEVLRPMSRGPMPCFQGTEDAEFVVLAVDDSDVVSVRVTSRPILSSEGDVLGSVYTLQDVTEEQKRQKELAYAARHDALTGLLNRAAFDSKIEDRLSTADTHPFAILYIDLDYFKALNDAAGHAAGDAALKSIASGIKQALPKDADIARLGGDEFTALFTVHGEEQAASTADSVLNAIRNAELGPTLPSRKLAASIGIAVVNDSATTAADALAYADDACYASKAAGRNRYSVFLNAPTVSTSGLTAARMAGDTIDALDEGRLQIFGQEIRSLTDPWGSPACVEVLARLVGRGGQTVSPAEFIPAAERFGVASKIDRWIIATALRKFGCALSSGNLRSLAFNLSAQTLSDANLWEFVNGIIEETGSPHSAIVFEITETAAVTNFDAAEHFVRHARSRGCRVSLDDFGAGLSSFEYLRRFPVDCIKINGSFVQNMATSRFDREIVASICGIAKALDCTIVAEKIEDCETLALLAGMNVAAGQGFVLHRPESLEDIVERLSPHPADEEIARS